MAIPTGATMQGILDYILQEVGIILFVIFAVVVVKEHILIMLKTSKRRRRFFMAIENDEVAYELGVDLNSTLTFSNGDINLTTYEDNLIQGVMNRLNTDLDELDLFYDEYGSILTRFLGWKTNDETLGFIEAEIENTLENEPRLESSDATCTYNGEGQVMIQLNLYPITGDMVDTNMVLTTTGVVEIETDEYNFEENENEEGV
jgi:phage baseplate assembly protein W